VSRAGCRGMGRGVLWTGGDPGTGGVDSASDMVGERRESTLSWFGGRKSGCFQKTPEAGQPEGAGR